MLACSLFSLMARGGGERRWMDTRVRRGQKRGSRWPRRPPPLLLPRALSLRRPRASTAARTLDLERIALPSNKSWRGIFPALGRKQASIFLVCASCCLLPLPSDSQRWSREIPPSHTSGIVPWPNLRTRGFSWMTLSSEICRAGHWRCLWYPALYILVSIQICLITGNHVFRVSPTCYGGKQQSTRYLGK
jgi:hypothetical protein